MENNIINNNEMEQLKKQLTIFKEKLDKQTIVSDKMLREATHSKIMWIRNMNRYISVASVVLIPMLYPLFNKIGMPIGASILIFLLMICEAVYNFINTRGMKTLAAGNLIEAGEWLIRFKRNEKLQMMIEIPVIIIWLIWISLTCFSQFLAGALIGSAIGLGLAFWMLSKELRYIKEITETIEEFKSNIEE
ncbi:hypothetical protein [Prevotella sp. MGM1]|uniref:hypothetical protein n=1 Tax=Prevotella sp. MGM1 TaxID=2033405 RepID=UPI000CE9C322|nr:hypothetical protein [Prevotella sp. MGM1]GAY26952.1 hypothetical protein PvtlMGM1_0252 [Prevotella sp. MGM1]